MQVIRIFLWKNLLRLTVVFIKFISIKHNNSLPLFNQIGLERNKEQQEYSAAVWLCMGNSTGDMKPWQGIDELDSTNPAHRLKIECANNNYTLSSGDGFRWKFALNKKDESVGFVRDDVLREKKDIYMSSPGNSQYAIPKKRGLSRKFNGTVNAVKCSF